MTNVLLVDEINRATPRTQSALLEAMAEGQVSVEGTSRRLPDPFFLIATESPGDAEGTFPLPEVQKDRFFMTVSIGYPDRAAEREVMSIGTELSHPLSRIEAVSDLATLVEMQRQVLEVHVDPALGVFVLCSDYKILRLNIVQTSEGFLTGFKLAALGARPGERLGPPS